MSIRVAVVDDDALLRAGIAAVLDSCDDLQLVAEADSGLAGVAAVVESRADVVLMDIRMPGIDGIEATRRIVAGRSEARVLVLTTFGHDDYVLQALEAGASGFLLKRTPPERLLEAIRIVHAGDSLIDHGVTGALVEAFVRRGGMVDESPLATLTEREREVLRLVGEGLANAAIAEVLFMAESTAKTHLKRVFAKLGLRDRAQAVILAYETGLVTPGRRRPGGC
jgi:DNA-binding NarL/FixJ family response regulator